MPTPRTVPVIGDSVMPERTPTVATLWLGNPSAVNPSTREPLGEQITEIGIHREWNTLDEIIRTICHTDGHWSQHSTGKPSWVASDDAEIASRVAGWFGCPIGDPAAAAAAHHDAKTAAHRGGSAATAAVEG